MNSVPKNCTKLKTVTDNSASNSSISQPSVSSSVAGETRMCKLDTGNFRKDFIFSKLQSFVKIKPSLNGVTNLSFTDVGKSCQNWEFLMWQICL